LTPFFYAEVRVVASVSISGPTIPISPKADMVLSPVIEYTQRISLVLGYVRPSSSAETNSQDLIARTLSMSQFNEHRGAVLTSTSAGPFPGVTGKYKTENMSECIPILVFA
jgi:hypothetical protein